MGDHEFARDHLEDYGGQEDCTQELDDYFENHFGESFKFSEDEIKDRCNDKTPQNSYQ